MEISELVIGRHYNNVSDVTYLLDECALIDAVEHYRLTGEILWKGVELTEQWLEGFGARKAKSRNDFYRLPAGIILIKYQDGFNIHIGNGVTSYATHLEYVHTLQNLYHSLTGAELKIKGCRQ